MKKAWIGFILSLLMISVVVSAAPEAVPGSSKVQVSLISQEPDPVNPGEIVDIRFKIENYGSEATDELIFEFIEQYPFSVYSGTTERNIGSLQSRQIGEDSVILLYKVKVDESAVAREEEIDIRYRSASDTMTPNWITFRDFPVRIRTRDLSLSTEVSSTPDPIPPGKEAEIKITVKNDADSLIRDVKVKLDSSGEGVPFAPIKSTTEKSIYQLDSKDSADFVFTVIAEPDAEGGVYKIPLEISYTDATGESYSKEDIIGLRIDASPDILATVDSAEGCGESNMCTVTFKIVNRGLTDIKLLSTELENTEDYDVLSQEEVYVGNIDSDDYETVDYKLKLKSKEAINVPLELTFMDSTNKEYAQKKDVVLHAENINIGNGSGGGFTGYAIIVAIVAVGLGVYFWRRKKRKKK